MAPRVDWNLVWPRGSVKFLLVECRSGLGNRMRVLAAALRAAKAMPDRLLALSWDLDGHHLHCPVTDLFSNTFLVLSPDYFSSTGFIDHHAIRDQGPNFLDPRSGADVVWVTEENFFYLTGDRGVMWGQHGPHRMRNPGLRDELLAGFDALVPVPAVARRVQAYAREHFALGDGRRPLLGVHIRRGDNTWANRHVPTSLFPRAVAGALAGRPAETALFVCSDSPEAEEAMRRAFPGRVLTYPKRTPALARGSSALAVQDALAEMYLLSQTDLIVRTPSSTFSQVASWLGRVPTREVGPLEHDW